MFLHKKLPALFTALILAFVLFCGTAAAANESYVYRLAGMSETSALKLASPAESGIVCGVFTLRSDGERVQVYCCDPAVFAADGARYARLDLEDAGYYSAANAQRIRAVAAASYPFVSLAAMRAAYNAAHPEALFAALSADEAMAGAQAAIWTLAGAGERYAVDRAAAGEALAASADRADALCAWLLSLTGAASPLPLPEITATAALGADEDPVRFTVTFGTAGKNADGSRIPLSASFDHSAAAADARTENKDGSYTWEMHVKKGGRALTLTVSGLQNAGRTVSFFSPQGGRESSQSFVGVLDSAVPFSRSFTFSADDYKRDVTLVKTDADDGVTPLAGAVFSLYRQTGAAPDPAQDALLQSGVTTGADGKALLRALRYDTNYYLLETAAPAGYDLPGTAQPVLLPACSCYAGGAQPAGAVHTCAVRFTAANTKHRPVSRSITIVKTSSADSALRLAGAVFSLYRQKGSAPDPARDALLQSGVTTGSNGSAVLPELRYDTNYYLVETAAPQGYVLSARKLLIPACAEMLVSAAEAAAHTCPTSYTFADDPVIPPTRDLVLTKTDSADTARRLPGAVFTLYEQRGDSPDAAQDTVVLSGLVTGADGTLTVTGLSCQKHYYLLETAAPAGYRLSAKVQPLPDCTCGNCASLVRGEVCCTVRMTVADQKIPAPPATPEPLPNTGI